MSSCFVGYLLKAVIFCCSRCLYFREQSECFENFAALFDVPRSCIYWKKLKILSLYLLFSVKLTVLWTLYKF